MGTYVAGNLEICWIRDHQKLLDIRTYTFSLSQSIGYLIMEENQRIIGPMLIEGRLEI